MKKSFFLISAVSIWVVLAAGGLFALAEYSETPGDPGTPVGQWPEASTLVLSQNAKTLVMFVHPLCSCSHASVAELAKLTAKTSSKIQSSIVFTYPSGFSKQDTDDSLLRKAQKIPNVHIVQDNDGKEAELFGSETSGHVFLFDENRQQIFNGGITAARGHEGDNVGAETILALANQNTSLIGKVTSMFGCLLNNPKPDELVASKNRIREYFREIL